MPVILRACLFALLASVSPALAADKPLAFSLPMGEELNALYRDGPVAAHVTVTGAPTPRLVVAFPAGNSGVALWFQGGPIRWRAITAVKGVNDGPLHGVSAQISADAPQLTIRQALLGSVRVLRDFGYNGQIPQGVETAPKVDGAVARWARKRLDGAPGYRLTVEVGDGGSIAREGGALRFIARPGAPLMLKITALTGDEPLTPVPAARLFTAQAAGDQRLRDVLEFLTYKEKLLAGSWRYNTYFGRDGLMSLHMLRPAIQPEVMEGGLAAVLERLGPQGDVAHEEDIGEFAVLAHRAAGQPLTAKPVYDYKMVDDDFMLAPVAAGYLLDPKNAKRVQAFLRARLPGGERHGDALMRNLAYVLRQAAPFADQPTFDKLIGLKPGSNVGEWRDSQMGLGGGRYAYNINGVFVPAALNALMRLQASGLLDDYGARQGAFKDAKRLHDVWATKAPALFNVAIDAKSAGADIATYAQSLGVDPAKALASVAGAPVQFHALALDAAGKPIRVVNSDHGFALLFTDPPQEEIAPLVDAVMRPFPAGLLTDAGVVVANPVYAGQSYWDMFDNGKYHGAVIWGWQHAVLAAGLEHQLRRKDLGAATLQKLRDAQTRLWSVITASTAFKTSELWSWSYKDGVFVPEPYGQKAGHETESQVVQLWSVAFLGVLPPSAQARPK